jgi:hypothetical protein
LIPNAANLVRALMAELPGAAVRAAANIVSFVFRVSLADGAAAPADASQPQLRTLDRGTDLLATTAGAAAMAATAPGVKSATTAFAPQLQGAPTFTDADAAFMDLDGAAMAYYESGSSSGGWDSTAVVDSLAAPAVPGEPFAGAACPGACQLLLCCGAQLHFASLTLK